MALGSLTGASRTVATSASPPASTQPTSSPAALKATTPLVLPASWVGVWSWPLAVASVNSQPSAMLGT